MQSQHRKKLLLADDDLVVLKVMSLKLSSVGYEVVKVHDSSLITRRVAEEKPHAILLDLDFGPNANDGPIVWNGVKILDWLGRIESLATIPVIVITSETSLEIHDRCKKAGAASVFTKPVDFDRLQAEIHRLIGR